ncbi:MAG TPA: hypothetical protein VMU16_04360 [Candidatus Binataceae bacterium]|nr:hypothetical protein [Candidatus Binataceae bacterium]
MPRNKLHPTAITKVTAFLFVVGPVFLEDWNPVFLDRIDVEPGTVAYRRAAFFNAWWLLSHIAGAGHWWRNEPCYFAAFLMLTAGGDAVSIRYKSARVRLREIVAKVRRAADRKSTMRPAWRRKTLSRYPVIAKLLHTFDRDTPRARSKGRTQRNPV